MVEISDINKLNNKISSFKKVYNSKENINEILYITDFDYTITRKFNYITGERFHNTYSIYNQDAFDGDQTSFLAEDKRLFDLYGKYEDDTSIDYETRKNKSFEWYKLSLINMSNEKIKKESFKKMVELSFENIKFRNEIKTLFEILIKENIPIIIISGGIKEIIIETLKKLNIDGFESYLDKKRLIVIANSLLDENNKIKNWNEKENENEIIYPFNKNIIIKKDLEKYFIGFKNIIIAGDLISDYNSINEIEIDKEKNVIAFGFLEYNPKKIESNFNYKEDSMFKEYISIFDAVFVNDQGYQYIIDVIKKIFSK